MEHLGRMAGFTVRSISKGTDPMRAIIAVLCLSLLSGAAAAGSADTPSPGSPTTSPGAPTQPQQQQPSPTTGMGRQQAPIGHRQPTQRDLPPRVRENEKSPGQGAPDPYGPLPQICRNC
jgi:hypothetical protein